LFIKNCFKENGLKLYSVLNRWRSAFRPHCADIKLSEKFSAVVHASLSISTTFILAYWQHTLYFTGSIIIKKITTSTCLIYSN